MLSLSSNNKNNKIQFYKILSCSSSSFYHLHWYHPQVLVALPCMPRHITTTRFTAMDGHVASLEAFMAFLPSLIYEAVSTTLDTNFNSILSNFVESFNFGATRVVLLFLRSLMSKISEKSNMLRSHDVTTCPYFYDFINF